MLILEQANHIVETTLKDRFALAKEGKPAPIEMTCADFDGVIFHMYSPQDDKNILNLSIQTSAFATINKYGLQARLKQIYGPHLVGSPESGFNVTLTVNTAQLPANSDELAQRFALLKRHIYAQPFEHVFEQIDQGKPVNEILDIPYRGDERTFITTQGKDRVTVVYSINFKDKDDIILGKVFLGEFKKSVGGAPSVDFSQNTPPGEIASVKNLGKPDGFITQVLFDRHFKKESRAKTIDMAIIFRNYLMYHLKCSKSHLNTRMRIRVETLLKVLNRAKQELPKEKKTASGRTFARAPGAGSPAPGAGPSKFGGPAKFGGKK